MTRIYILAFTSIAVIATLDYWTGHEISFSVFYLLPVALLAWRTRLKAALVAALLSAILWYSADVSSHEYSHPIIGVWNATARAIIFVFAAVVLDRVRTLLERERALARTDPQTGLYNLRAFEELLARELARSQRTGRAFTLAYMDLDRFKAVNDRFGHAVGDLVLREVGTKLATTLRGIDATARLGGDEFAFLLSETDEAQARLGLSRIQSSISLTLRSIRAASEVGVSASIGAVVYSGGAATSDDLLGEADALMYRAKQERPGSIRIESPEAWRASSTLASATTRLEP